MRTWLLAMTVLAACKSGKDGGSPTPAPITSAARAPLTAPSVSTPTVLAKTGAKPPHLLLLGEDGSLLLAGAASWEDLDRSAIAVGKPWGDRDVLLKMVREEAMVGRAPLESVDVWNKRAEEKNDVDLTMLEDTSGRQPTGESDDPPPPEEDPDEEPYDPDSTGSTVTLEEGKMGKKDSDRAEGQYRMQKQVPAGTPMPPRVWRAPYPYQARENGGPVRVADAVGFVPPSGVLDPLLMMVIASPRTAAKRLIDVISQSDAAIAVSSGGTIRPLHLQFKIRDSAEPAPSHWVEVRVAPTGVIVEAVPDAPIEVTSLDARELATTLDKARTARGIQGEAPLDILVDDDVTAQRLIDVIVALDTAGVRAIGIGNAPPAAERTRRGHRIPAITFGSPSSQGNLDKAEIRRVVKASRAQLDACYAQALAGKPTLEGTILTQFFITPNGSVASASGSGVDGDLSACFAKTLKSLEFPKPPGGGGVQVTYPFTVSS